MNTLKNIGDKVTCVHGYGHNCLKSTGYTDKNQMPILHWLGIYGISYPDTYSNKISKRRRKHILYSY